jgi:hypothetical protein
MSVVGLVGLQVRSTEMEGEFHVKNTEPRACGGELPTDLLTLAEAAAHLNLTIDTVKYHVTRQREIPTYKKPGYGHIVFVSAVDLPRLKTGRGGWRGGRKDAP